MTLSKQWVLRTNYMISDKMSKMLTYIRILEWIRRNQIRDLDVFESARRLRLFCIQLWFEFSRVSISQKFRWYSSSIFIASVKFFKSVKNMWRKTSFEELNFYNVHCNIIRSIFQSQKQSTCMSANTLRFMRLKCVFNCAYTYDDL